MGLPPANRGVGRSRVSRDRPTDAIMPSGFMKFQYRSSGCNYIFEPMNNLSTGLRLAEFAGAVRESSIKRLRKVPSGKENWRVSPDAMSFADTIRHLIDADEWLFKQLEKSIPAMKGEAGVEDIKNRDEYDRLLNEFESTGRRRIELLRNMPDNRFSEIMYDERFGEVTVWWVIVRGNLDHEIHHRGQIAAYLRVV